MSERMLLGAVIFDVDGTIIDTEQIQSDAFLSVLNAHGVSEAPLTSHGTVHVPGETTCETWKRLGELYDLPDDHVQLTADKRQAALDALRGEIKPMPGVTNLVSELQKEEVKLALASSAQQERVDYIISGLGLIGIF